MNRVGEVVGIAGREVTVTAPDGTQAKVRITGTALSRDGAGWELVCEPLPDGPEEVEPVPEVEHRSKQDWQELVRYATKIRQDFAGFTSRVRVQGDDPSLYGMALQIRSDRHEVGKLRYKLKKAKERDEQNMLLNTALWDLVTDEASERGTWASLAQARDLLAAERAELKRLRGLASANLAEVDRVAASKVWNDSIKQHEDTDGDTLRTATGLIDVFFHLFGAQDGDAAFESLIFDQMIRVAELVHGIPCGCVEGEDEVKVCGRCRALARVNDRPV